MTHSNEIRFGTDGWRALIAEDFTFANVRRIAHAAGAVFAADNPGGTVLVGYDTRFRAADFAAEAASVIAAHGLTVKLSDRMLPTPALSWATAHTDAIGAVMLTASHNPAEYLGFKLKMADGGSAPPDFTGRVEAVLPPEVITDDHGEFETVDRVTEYLAALRDLVDADAIAAAKLRVVVDPLYGAGQGYLADTLRALGVDVHELHAEPNPGFAGLHPEPIPPHTDAMSAYVAAHGYDAGFVTDGDADRIGACDAHGAFVNPHRIFSLIVRHLVEAKGMTGAVVKTLSTSVLVDRIAQSLNLESRTTPVGFKFIYEHMVKGGVMIGGEESGGIGVPAHVRERDGLAMALFLTEMMAMRAMGLAELVEDLFTVTGPMEYGRIDMKLDQRLMDTFVSRMPTMSPPELAGLGVLDVLREDGIKFLLPDDAWLLMRTSGTEPLVRVYAEASSAGVVDDLLAEGRALVHGEGS